MIVEQEHPRHVRLDPDHRARRFREARGKRQEGDLGGETRVAARRQLVWEGFALGRVTQRTTDNLGPVLDAAVVDIFSSFPLQP